MTRFIPKPITHTDQRAGIAHRWEATRKLGGFDIFSGVIDLRNNEVKFRYAGELDANTVADISAFMHEVQAQHRANSFSEQIEKDMQEGSDDEHSDPHSRADRFAAGHNGHAVVSASDLRTSDSAHRDIGGEA